MQRAFLCASFIACFFVWGPSSLGQTATPTPAATPAATPTPTPCAPLPDVKMCSYAGLNGDCTIGIDRLNPITPPTVYARPTTKITVRVINPSPYETLSLDWKSTSAVVPPDSFSTVFSALIPNLGKITVLSVGKEQVRPPYAITISEEQQKLLNELQSPLVTAKPALELIKRVSDPPPLGLCLTDPTALQDWLNLASWKARVISALQDALQKSVESDAIRIGQKQRVDDLAVRIQSLFAARQITASEFAFLNMNQLVLTDALKQTEGLTTRLTALWAAVKDVSGDDAGLKKQDPKDRTKKIDPVIAAFPSKDKTYQNQVWVLNYANTLAPVIKQVTNPTPPSGGSQADGSTKASLATVTVQFQSNPRFEVSTGLIVPLTPYHSYSAAAVATNGVVTGNVVQVTKTYTVVPMVSTNILIHDFVAKQRAAWFGSISVGYNPATSSVEFGVGPSFSWRSIVLTGVADIGRDTQLAGGFTVGQTLPASNPPKPLTTTVWSVKPAVAVSIRIPLGGASK